MIDSTLLQSEVFRLPNMKSAIRGFPGTKLQQILICDDQGYVYILEANGDQLKIDSKQQISTGKEIIFMDLLLSPNTLEKDRIIISSGSQVIGLTKKLREYLKYDTFSADTIQFAMIEGNQLFTAGEFMLNEYIYQNDKVTQSCFFLCPDKINCLQLHYLSSKAHAIIGCQDSSVRVLNQDQVQYVLAMTSPVVCMHVYSPQYKDISSQNRFEQRRCFVYGLEDGTIIAADMGFDRATVLFTFKVQSVAFIKPVDLQKNGKTELVIARQDGILEVYSEGELRIQKKINEGITSIECGQFINLNGPTELLISTFSGKILLLRENQNIVSTKNPKELEQKVKQLKSEIAELQKQLTNKQPSSAKFKLSHKLLKNDKDGNHKLIIDCQYPIQMVVLVGNTTQKCFVIKDQKVSNFEITITQCGNYNVFVTPYDMSASQSFNINVKSLSSYQSINLMSIKHLPLSILNLKGSFSKQDINMWLTFLADLPYSQEETQTYLLRNAFTDSYLQVKFKQGQALFKSDSIAAIYACRQYILSQANERGIQVDLKHECNDEGVLQYLQKLKLQSQEYEKIQKNYEILPALKELLVDNPITILSKEFQQLHNSESEIIEQYKELPSKSQYLEDLLIETYVARCNLKIQDQNIDHVKSLWHRDFQELIQYVLK